MICVDLWRVVKMEKRGPSPKIPRIRVAQMAYFAETGQYVGSQSSTTSCIVGVHLADKPLSAKFHVAAEKQRLQL